MRRGCSTSWLAVRPLAQKSCQLCGFCLSAEIFVTRFSSTVTSRPHDAMQYRQKVWTVRVLTRSWCLIAIEHIAHFVLVVCRTDTCRTRFAAAPVNKRALGGV